MTEADLPHPHCSACALEFRLGKPRCMWCGAEFHRPKAPEAAPACPVCETPLGSGEREGWACHPCDRCGGLWIEPGVLEQLEQRYAAVPAKPGPIATNLPPLGNPSEDRPFYRKCPRCRGQMARQRYQHVSHVVVDQCVSHGIWLDRYELEHVLAFLESGGLARARAHLAEREREDREEAKKIANLLRDVDKSSRF